MYLGQIKHNFDMAVFSQRAQCIPFITMICMYRAYTSVRPKVLTITCTLVSPPRVWDRGWKVFRISWYHFNECRVRDASYSVYIGFTFTSVMPEMLTLPCILVSHPRVCVDIPIGTNCAPLLVVFIPLFVWNMSFSRKRKSS